MTLVSGLTMTVFDRAVGRRLLGGIAISVDVETIWYISN
jgi:hypothetical protein